MKKSQDLSILAKMPRLRYEPNPPPETSNKVMTEERYQELRKLVWNNSSVCSLEYLDSLGRYGNEAANVR